MSVRNRSAGAPNQPRRPTSKGRTRTASPKAASIDQYLAHVAEDQRAVLQQLRQTIQKLVPDAEECISYAMPAFRLHGKVVAGFAATSKGCSYFPFSGSTLGTLAGDLRGYEKTKSSLHFTPDRPLPTGIVRKLLQARLAEIRG